MLKKEREHRTALLKNQTIIRIYTNFVFEKKKQVPWWRQRVWKTSNWLSVFTAALYVIFLVSNFHCNNYHFFQSNFIFLIKRDFWFLWISVFVWLLGSFQYLPLHCLDLNPFWEATMTLSLGKIKFHSSFQTYNNYFCLCIFLPWVGIFG